MDRILPAATPSIVVSPGFCPWSGLLLGLANVALVLALGSCRESSAQSGGLKVTLRGPLHAVAYLCYRRQPIGEAVLRNPTGVPIDPGRLDIRVEGQNRRLLNEDWSLHVSSIPPGAEVSLPLLPPLGGGILDEPSGELVLTFTWWDGDGSLRASTRRALPLLQVGHFAWDDPERIVLYVQPHHDDVARLGRTALRRARRQGASVLPPLGVAACVYEELRTLGIRYVEDSRAPHAEAIAGRVVDTLQVPGVTLAEGIGDCDDLSVLLASALEAASLKTALAVGEGHVLPLVECGRVAKPGAATLVRDVLVEREGVLWAPLESTVLGRAGDFLEAWSAGSERCAAVQSGAFRLVVTRESWERFPPPPRRGGRRAPNLAVAFDGPALGAELERLKSFLVARVKKQVVSAVRDGGAQGALEESRVAARAYAESGFHADAVRVLSRGIERAPRTHSELPAARLELLSYRLARCLTLERGRREHLLALESDLRELLERDEFDQAALADARHLWRTLQQAVGGIKDR